MIDIKLIRENPDVVFKAMEKRGEDLGQVREIIDLDNTYRQLLKEAETLRARRNDVSKQISRMKDKPADLIAEMRQVGDRITQIEAEANQVADRLEDKSLRLPNLPAEDVPVGKDAADNKEVRSWGKPKDFTFRSFAALGVGGKAGYYRFSTWRKALRHPVLCAERPRLSIAAGTNQFHAGHAQQAARIYRNISSLYG